MQTNIIVSHDDLEQPKLGARQFHAPRPGEALIQFSPADITHVRQRAGRMLINSLSLFAIVLALAISLASCGPIPCPIGYGDSDWCNPIVYGGEG